MAQWDQMGNLALAMQELQAQRQRTAQLESMVQSALYQGAPAMGAAGGLAALAGNAWGQQAQAQALSQNVWGGGYGGGHQAAKPPPKEKKPPTGDAGIIGLCAAFTKALENIVHLDTDMTLEEIAWKVCGYIGKTAAKYWGAEDDSRYTQRCSMVKAQAIIEEFVIDCMHALNAGIGHKNWFAEANLAEGLVHAVMGTFVNKQATFLQRCPKPIVQKTVEDTVARFREEERVQKGLWEAVVVSGLDDAFHKQCWKHLQNSYDRSHMQAAYGTSESDTPEFGLVQDFVRFWMEDFIGRAHHLLHENYKNDEEEHFAFVSTLFQHLTAPEQCCLPFELVSQPGAMPPENWEYVAEIAMKLTKNQDQEYPKKKKRKGGGGGGGGSFQQEEVVEEALEEPLDEELEEAPEEEEEEEEHRPVGGKGKGFKGKGKPRGKWVRK
eukprot:TRINITY_DN1769_c0_g2_i1.p1 TRINITY_DN1769_c0_g2~~TRINITY_DN1769_c0_g2_i1.p1  ORF type:complete len:471 (-),score=158.07 TRINITY_DN1769_c0_g2_i1:114-1424(-)